MRIALDATYSVDPQPSGIAIYSQELLSGLAETHPADEFVHCYRPKRFLRAQPATLPNVQRRLLIPPVPSFRADLFHALNQRVDVRAAKRVISTFHDLFVMTGEYSSPEFRARFTEQARHAAKNSDLIIAVSEFTANQVSSLLGFARSRIRVVYHGVHTSSSEEPVERENIIMFAGVLQARKNVERLIAAFEHVPDDWRLVLAGAAAGYRADQIMERVEQSGCRNRIEVTGHLTRTELERLYARAAIFAFPSLDEGFGIPVLEAMAHGLPVITSNRSALVEVAGDAALLVNPYETDELVSALLRLIGDSDLRTDLASRGLARAKLYTWDRAVRETYSIYRELVT